MKQHMREYLISRVRSGVVIVSERGVNAIINPPTIRQTLEANMVFMELYEEAEFEGVMDQDEMLEWMKEQGLWTQEDQSREDGLTKDIERLKEEIYSNRNNEPLRERIREYLRAGEKQLAEIAAKKSEYEANTCEGYSLIGKYKWIVENCTTFEDGRPYDFNEISIDYITAVFQSSFLQEKQIRELARSEPWHSTWSVAGDSQIPLFSNQDAEMTHDQKGLVIWSQMYDNIQEHTDCPNSEVIEDDDVLDGWFIIQKKKRDRERLEEEFEDGTHSEKIKQADEVFMMTPTQKQKDQTESMNSSTASMFKKQREKMIMDRGTVQQGEFFDERMNQRAKTNTMYKDKFRD